ncbi:MAG: sigma-54-dependent Fis family transcriptional regulator [Deltaproteobacteria bacterium]|nr:sigma-54-dependent Fis family transcriptional regulator [Deltaproteobacteria bacterium]
MLSLALSKDGFAVWTASSGKEGLETLREQPFDICVTDIRMPGMDGLAFIQDAQKLGAKGPTFIAMSAYGDKQLALEALRRGAFDYISKPFDPDELAIKLRLVLERNRLSKESEPLPARPSDSVRSRSGTRPLDEIVAVSLPMQSIARTVRKVASFPTTVLITGETGTGKERIAGAIHLEGRRSHRPFVAVNCGAIPDNLLESELFGHVKGAFTDATSDRVGLFETASGGTLFLDEIGELPMHLQVKLFRALVEAEIRPVGATRVVRTDVRVIAATSRDLRRQVSENAFREELFHRLNVVSIHIPPLRDRREDIRPLVDHFCAAFEKRLGLGRLSVSPEAMEMLQGYSWPGNVRELENALERAFVLSEGGGVLEADDLDDRFREAPPSARRDEGDAEDLSLRLRLREYEEELIRKALERTGGNRSRAAVLLGISHRALLYKVKEYGIP